MLGHRPEDPRFTYGDYVQWQGDERWELIDGVPQLMSPSPGRRHQEAVGELFLQIASFLRSGPCRVYVAPFDIRLPTADEPDASVETVVQPDLSVICDPEKLDDAGCRGAPDWIVEVLSPNTTPRDEIQKRDLYERHGVREYWILHPVDRWLTTYRLDPQTGKLAEPQTTEARGGTRSVVLPDLEIDWTPVFER